MTNISLGQTIDGSLSSTDTKNPKKLGSFSDDYTLTGISNWQQVQVNMDSTAINSYLQLVNASTGEVIALNDDLDFNAGKNSQLSFTKIPGVDYIIRATSANSGETGNYTINTSSLGIASSLIITGRGRIGTVDPLGRFAEIEKFFGGEGESFSDIALSYDNKLFAIKDTTFDSSQLYSINPGSSDESSLIGNFPSGVKMTSIEFLPNGTLYGVSDSSGLYTINRQTGAASFIAQLNDNGSSKNAPTDLAFDSINNQFLYTLGDTVYFYSLTGELTRRGSPDSFQLQGLSFEGTTLVGFAGDERYIVNSRGEAVLDKMITGQDYFNSRGGISGTDNIFGAGSIPSATRTQAPTPPTPTPPTPTLTSTSPLTTLPTTNNTSGASKSKYTASEINKDYLNPVDKATIRIWQLGKDGKPEQNPTQLVENKETYVLIHGFKNDSTDTATIAELAKQIGSPKDQGGEGKQVILIDWKDAAEALQPAFAAEWISDVAAFASDVLKRIWKIDNANINLIGHSLGTLVASEIGLDLGTEDKDVLNSEYRRNPNIDRAKRINTLIALDPPGDATTIPFIGYDLSKERNGTQSPVDFNKVSNFSRAFWGSLLAGDGLGKPEFAATADESIYVDFKLPEFNLFLNRDQQNPLASHGNIVNLFNNLLKSNDNIGSLFQLNTPKHTEWQEDAFGKNEAILTATAKLSFDNDPNTKPLLLFAKDANRQNNDIIYGGVGDNTGENKLSSNSARNSLVDAAKSSVFNYPQINSPGNDKIYGNSGNDEIFGLTGNDTINGGKGNDTIYGEQDNDIIFGDDNQDIIWGGKGDDTINGGDGNDTLNGDDNNDVLIGGAGSDILNGGFGDDVLYGGTDKDQDTLIGGLGNTTFLLGLDNGLPVTTDKRNRDKVDIIEDFRAGVLFGFGRGPDVRGISAIGLINGLKADQIVVERFGEGLGDLFNQKTAIIANGQYLAVLNGEWFNKADLRLTEIPNLVL